MNKTLRYTLIGLGILAGVAVLVFAGMYFGPMRWSAFGGPGGMMDAWGYDEMPHGFMRDGGGRFMLAFLSPALLIGWIIKALLLVGGVVLIVRLLNRPVNTAQSIPPSVDAGASAVEILKARYARGEITREQYLEMLADIG